MRTDFKNLCAFSFGTPKLLLHRRRWYGIIKVQKMMYIKAFRAFLREFCELIVPLLRHNQSGSGP